MKFNVTYGAECGECEMISSITGFDASEYVQSIGDYLFDDGQVSACPECGADSLRLQLVGVALSPWVVDIQDEDEDTDEDRSDDDR